MRVAAIQSDIAWEDPEANFERLRPWVAAAAAAGARLVVLPEKIGVAAIPPSSFYVNQHEGRHLVRWAFCKTDAVLDEGLRRLQKLRA